MTNDPTHRSLVRFFSTEDCEGDGSMVALLGGKGAALAQMCRMGLPVPPGFTVTSAAYAEVARTGILSPPLKTAVRQAMGRLERTTGRRLGGTKHPLLLSVRSGARVSMPGMMDTILNLGLNTDTVEALARETRNRRFAFDCFRRFVSSFASAAMGVDQDHFDDILENDKNRHNLSTDAERNAGQWQTITHAFLETAALHGKQTFPHDPEVQLFEAIAAVFRSWDSPRAQTYRELYGLEHTLGTAVSVQAMVFGNRDERSFSGVVFSRNPLTGARHLHGEYAAEAQGDEIVGGFRTPLPVCVQDGNKDEASMEHKHPQTFRQLESLCRKLEAAFGGVQDVEFTVESGTLYILQTRSGPCNSKASVAIAADMVAEGTLTPKQALMGIAPDTLRELVRPVVDPEAVESRFALGIGASAGTAVGRPAFSSDEAVARARAGETVVLVRDETSPNDIRGINASAGVLTVKGGATSHAAVVTRGMGKPCVVGCSSITIALPQGTITSDGTTLGRDGILTIDGSTGAIYAAALPTRIPPTGKALNNLLEWAQPWQQVRVWGLAPSPDHAAAAVALGAQGMVVPVASARWNTPTWERSSMIVHARSAEEATVFTDNMAQTTGKNDPSRYFGLALRGWAHHPQSNKVWVKTQKDRSPHGRIGAVIESPRCLEALTDFSFSLDFLCIDARCFPKITQDSHFLEEMLAALRRDGFRGLVGVWGNGAPYRPWMRLLHRYAVDHLACVPEDIPTLRIAAAQAGIADGRPDLLQGT